MSSADQKETLKIFDRRASGVLKQVKELSTLCGSPACLVIHNPNDVINPWRFWPPNPSEFRKVVEIYNQRNGRRGVVVRNREKGSDGLLLLRDDQEKSFGNSNLTLNELDASIANVQARIDRLNAKKLSANVPLLKDDLPREVTAGDEQCSNLAGKEQTLAEIRTSQEINDCGDVGQTRSTLDFDIQMWEDNEFFNLDELMKLLEQSDEEDFNVICGNTAASPPNDQTQQPVADVAETAVSAAANDQTQQPVADFAEIADSTAVCKEDATELLSADQPAMSIFPQPDAVTTFAGGDIMKLLEKNYNEEDVAATTTTWPLAQQPTDGAEDTTDKIIEMPGPTTDGERNDVIFEDLCDVDEMLKLCKGWDNKEPVVTSFAADSSLVPSQRAVSGNKRKEPEKVFSFSELISPSCIANKSARLTI